LDARLVTLQCKKITVAKFKEVKTGLSDSPQNRQVWQNLLRKAMAHKGQFFPVMVVVVVVVVVVAAAAGGHYYVNKNPPVVQSR
jgi:hypothetical protein